MMQYFKVFHRDMQSPVAIFRFEKDAQAFICAAGSRFYYYRKIKGSFLTMIRETEGEQ